MKGAKEQLWSVVKSIPAGRCASYGQVGRAMTNPLSGLLVGRWIAFCPPDVPWWRVVRSDGSFATAKRDPFLAQEQMRLLRLEGVPTEGQRVDMSKFGVDFETELNKQA